MPEARSIEIILNQEILPCLPPVIRAILRGLPADVKEGLAEIRLRQNKPLMVVAGQRDVAVTAESRPTEIPAAAYRVTGEDVARALQIMSMSSLYALEEELKNGYLTLKGGHRVGLAGKAVLEGGRVKTLKGIASLNIRIAREIIGAADPVLPYCIDPGRGQVCNTLIVSPPQCGKTTLLRDLVRQISDGVPALKFPGARVGVVDERSEIAGCFNGIPQNNVGIRTDVLDACPKAEGMNMLLRAMSPQVIATDEIGRPEDTQAILEALNTGVIIIATAHGSSVQEVGQRPSMKPLIAGQVFDRYILLGPSRGVGTVEDVIDGATMRSLLQSRHAVRWGVNNNVY